MARPKDRAVRVRVVASVKPAGCFHWIITYGDGRHEIRSAYAYATAEGARLAGVVRAREIEGKV